MNPLRRILGRGDRRLRSPKLASAARAKRARDHLARQRERERVRLARKRARHETLAGRRRALRLLTPILFAASAIGGVILSTPIVERLWLTDQPLDRIAVQGAKRLTPEVVAAGAGAFAGRSLAEVDPEAVAASLTADAWIESARALRLPSGILVVRVVEREAIARWEDDGRTELVDREGGRFAGALPPAGRLPTVRGDADIAGSLPADAIEILHELGRHAVLAHDPDAITLHLPNLIADEAGFVHDDPEGFVLEVGKDGPRVLLGRRLLTQRVARLASLLDHGDETIRAARLIDLRYADRAVLRTEPASG